MVQKGSKQLSVQEQKVQVPTLLIENNVHVPISTQPSTQHQLQSSSQELVQVNKHADLSNDITGKKRSLFELKYDNSESNTDNNTTMDEMCYKKIKSMVVNIANDIIKEQLIKLNIDYIILE